MGGLVRSCWRCSRSRCHAERGPGCAPADVAIYAPVLRAGECLYDIESVRAVVFARPGAPWTAGVCYFDPDVVRVDFGAESEVAAIARGAVQDGIGGELAGDQDRVIGARTAVEQCGKRGPGVTDLGGVGGEGAGVVAGARRL